MTTENHDHSGPLTYLTAPGQHPDPEVTKYRLQAVQHAAAQLTAQGKAVYSPQLIRRAWAPQYIDPPPPDRFDAARAAVMQRCDEILFLQLPGWNDCSDLKADLDAARSLNKSCQPLPCSEPAVPNRWISYLLPGATRPAQEQEIAPGIFQVTTKAYRAVVKTVHGNLTFDLFHDLAPLAVDNFIYLSRDQQFYRNNQFHIIIPDLMMQAGCPNGDGTGNPGYSLPPPGKITRPYVRGTLAMHSDGDQNSGCQWFVVCGESAPLPPKYAIFGHLAEGQETLYTLAQTPPTAAGMPYPAERVVISNIDIVEQNEIKIETRLTAPEEAEAPAAETPPANRRAGNRRTADAATPK